jgi:hypothetical protein
MTEPLDFDNLSPAYVEAVRLQARSVLHHTVVAGTLTGLLFQAVADQLAGFATGEADDLRRLVEKAQALGIVTPIDVGPLEAKGNGEDRLAALVGSEEEALMALHAVIAHTGQEPRSEALEHLLEHVIMRKQQQVDYLRRALDQVT